MCLLLTYLNLNLSLKKLFRIFVPSSYFLSMLLIIFLQWKQFLRGRHVMFTVLVNLKRRCSRSIIVLERSAFKRNLRFPTFAWTEIIKENPTVWTQLQRAVQWGDFQFRECSRNITPVSLRALFTVEWLGKWDQDKSLDLLEYTRDYIFWKLLRVFFWKSLCQEVKCFSG